MTIDEISEDLQSQFGKPRNQTEDNIRYVLTLVAEHVEGDHVKTSTRCAMDNVRTLIDLNKDNKDKIRGIPLERYLHVLD